MKKFKKILIVLSAVMLLAVSCGKQPYTPPTQNQTAKQDAPKIESIRYNGEDGKTALELLKAKYQVQTKTFSFGEMVESINGIRADNNHFWALYADGKQTTVGASDYKTKNGEVIEWKWEEISANK